MSDGPGRVIQLLWYDGERAGRARSVPAWRELIEAIERRPPDRDLDAAAGEDGPEVRVLLEVLTRAEPLALQRLEPTFAAAVGDSGKIAPPLVLVEGELQPSHDEVEALRATVTLVAPAAKDDEALQTLLERATKALAEQDVPSSLAEELAGALRHAFAATDGPLTAANLDDHITQMLIEGGHFRRRTVFGGRHLRAWLHGRADQGSAPPPAVVYLPEPCATELPQMRRFEARIVAELRLAQEQHESAPLSLRAVAVARTPFLP